MNILWILVAIFHLISISFMGMCIARLFGYTRRYQLNENHHTLLFGFVKVEHFVTLYVIFISMFTLGSVVLVQYLSSMS